MKHSSKPKPLPTIHYKMYSVPNSLLTHCMCGNNVRETHATTNEALVGCIQCMRGIAKRDREAAKRRK